MAALNLYLRPDLSDPSQWLPPLAHYIVHADPDDSVSLSLDISHGSVPAPLATALIELACNQLAADEPYGMISIVDAAPAHPTVAADTAAAVDRALAVDRAPQVGPGPTPSEQAAAWEQVRRVKLLADQLRAAVDRWRFETAPSPWTEREPLVSVRIPTWRGARVLTERALPSILGGIYRNVEVIVCSDGPEPETRAAMAAIHDQRLRYIELPERPAYAQHEWSFWQTAGIHAVNRALDECRGAMIAPLDHDDAFTRDHVLALVECARAQQADMVYGQAIMEQPDDGWDIIGGVPLAHGNITHGSVMYTSRLAHMRMDVESWILEEPGDWNMWRRIYQTGARISHFERVVALHFRERTAIGSEDRRKEFRQSYTAAEGLRDLLHIGSAWLLDVPLRRPVAVAMHEMRHI